MAKPLKILLVILLIIVLIAGGYAAYLFTSYYRVEDNQELTVLGVAADGNPLPVDRSEPYTMTAWNIGFAA